MKKLKLTLSWLSITPFGSPVVPGYASGRARERREKSGGERSGGERSGEGEE